VDPEFDDAVWMSTPDACERLALSAREIYRLIDTGQLPAYKFGRLIRLRRADVENFAATA
jgi:excisionase family DNA binding protein